MAKDLKVSLNLNLNQGLTYFIMPIKHDKIKRFCQLQKRKMYTQLSNIRNNYFINK